MRLQTQKTQFLLQSHIKILLLLLLVSDAPRGVIPTTNLIIFLDICCRAYCMSTTVTALLAAATPISRTFAVKTRILAKAKGHKNCHTPQQAQTVICYLLSFTK